MEIFSLDLYINLESELLIKFFQEHYSVIDTLEKSTKRRRGVYRENSVVL